ncbi:MAG: hypothetical protein Q9166_007937 [cf. Caloplaca sp. 2 TL-2023]
MPRHRSTRSNASTSSSSYDTALSQQQLQFELSQAAYATTAAQPPSSSSESWITEDSSTRTYPESQRQPFLSVEFPSSPSSSRSFTPSSSTSQSSTPSSSWGSLGSLPSTIPESESESPSESPSGSELLDDEDPPSLSTRIWCSASGLYNRYADSRYAIVSDACTALCFIMFTPLFVLPVVIYAILKLLSRLIASVLGLPPRIRKRVPRAVLTALLVLGILGLGKLEDRTSPGVLGWGGGLSSAVGDRVLLLFEREINGFCGPAGRRLLYIHNQYLPAPFASSNKTCIPHFCPGTFSFLDHPNPYLVLGLPPPTTLMAAATETVTRQQIKKAYNNLILFYHPDKVHTHGLTPDKSTLILSIVRKAGKLLLDDDTRWEWDKRYVFGLEDVAMKARYHHTHEMQGFDWFDIAREKDDREIWAWMREKKRGGGDPSVPDLMRAWFGFWIDTLNGLWIRIWDGMVVLSVVLRKRLGF